MQFVFKVLISSGSLYNTTNYEVNYVKKYPQRVYSNSSFNTGLESAFKWSARNVDIKQLFPCRTIFTPTGSLPNTVVFTYATAMSAAPVRRVALGFVDIDFSLSSTSFYLEVENPTNTATASNFQYTVKGNSASLITSIKISYLALDQTFPYPFTFGYLTYVPAFSLVAPFVDNTDMNFTDSTGMVLNTSHDNAMLIFQHTIDIYSASKCFQVQFDILILNASFYRAQVSSNCNGMELYSFGASRIIFDKTAIENGGYYYFQYGSINSVNSTLSTLTFDSKLFIDETFMMGMTSFSVLNQPRFKFNSTLGPTSSVTTTMPYKKLQFMYWSLKYRGCPPTNPYFQLSTQLCFDICPVGTFPNQTLKMCMDCHYTCNACTSYLQCVDCDNSSFRIQSGTACPPMDGYFDNGTKQAVLCSDIMAYCSSCTDNSTCLSCQDGFYISTGLCLACGNISLGCLNCSSGTSCTQCDIGYILNNITNLCDVVPCTDLQCISCPISDNLCQECSEGYYPVNGICVPICGDNYVTVEEACDDGNLINKDGCNNICQIQADFICEPDPLNLTGSQCYYTGTIKLNPIYINKIDNQNQVQIKLQISPLDLTFWDTVNWKDIIKISQPTQITNYNLIKNADGTVTIIADYSGNIHNKQLIIQIDPSSSGDLSLQRTPKTIQKIQIIPSDNQLAYSYNEGIYQMAQNIAKFVMGIVCIGMMVFFVGVFCGKLVAVEMMAILQVTFFALGTLKELNPCFVGLSNLWISNGYNKYNNNISYMQDKYTPNQIKGILQYSLFLYNFNFSLSIIFIPVFLAGIALVLCRVFRNDQEKKQKFNVLAVKLVGEYTFTGLMFSSYLIGISFMLELSYGIKQISTKFGMVNLYQIQKLQNIIIIVSNQKNKLKKIIYEQQQNQQNESHNRQLQISNTQVFKAIMFQYFLITQQQTLSCSQIISQ